MPWLGISSPEMGLQEEIPILKIGTAFPLPTEMVEAFIQKCDHVLILEETEPVIELQIRDKSKIRGRLDGTLPNEGEMLPETITHIISELCREFSIPVGEGTSTAPLEKMVAALGLPSAVPPSVLDVLIGLLFSLLNRPFPMESFPVISGATPLE